MRRPRLATIVLFLGLSFACAREPGPPPRATSGGASGEGSAAAPSAAPAAGQPASAEPSVTVFPTDPTVAATLNLVPRGLSMEGAEVEWRIGDRVRTGTALLPLSGTGAKKGDSVQARVSVGGRTYESNAVTLRNAPPEIRRVRFVPETFRAGDTLGVEAEGGDPDGDAVAFSYRWEKNGRPAGTGGRIGEALRRGDSVSVTITPFDGESEGKSVTLRPEIRNAPPEVRGAVEGRLAGDAYTCRVVATDPDGDPLRFVLTASPPGMSIDESTGAIRWAVPANFKGQASATVSVADGNGGQAAYSFTISIVEEEPKGAGTR